MTSVDERIRLTVKCEFCDALNEMTLTGVADHEDVLCSLCGSQLGTVGSLRDRLALPVAKNPATRGANTSSWLVA
jgi:hypothetical protein